MSDGIHKNTRIGKYVVEKILGEGAFGVVVKARDPDLQKSVAIKKLKNPGHGGTAEGQIDTSVLFNKEAIEIGKLAHPNIVTVHGFGTDETDKAPYLVMEFIEGQTLEKLIASLSEMPLVEKLEIMQQVAEGLQFAHTRGVTHRDIKPANIMLLPDGTAKVLDFAVAPEGFLVGTPAYMAPEQFEGQGSDILTDVFSYGAVYYELVTGERAFDPNTPDRAQTSSYKPGTVSSRVAGCPPWLDDVIARLIEKRTQDRIESLEEMLLFTRPFLQKIKQEYAAEMASGISPLIRMGDRAAADRLIEKILRLDPLNRVARDARGNVRAGQRAELRARALELARSAQSRFDAGDFENARRSLEDALSMDPDVPGGAKLLAEARLKEEDRRGANLLVDEVINDIIEAGPGGMMPFQVESAYDKITTAVRRDPRCPDALALREHLMPLREDIRARKLGLAMQGSSEADRLVDERISEARIIRRKAGRKEDYDHAELILRGLPQSKRALQELSWVITDRREYSAQEQALWKTASLKASGDLGGALAVLNEFAERYMRRASGVLKERKALETALGIGVVDDPSAR